MADVVSISSDGSDTSPLFIVNNGQSTSLPSFTINISKRQYSIALAITSILCIILAIISAVFIVKSSTQTAHNNNNGRHKRDDNIVERFNFFQISDTHLDLHYNENISYPGQYCRNITRGKAYNKSESVAHYGRVGCDASIPLLQSAAQQMKVVHQQQHGSAKFVIITGDQMAHSYDAFKVNKMQLLMWSIGNSTKIIAESLNIPVIPAIGNNDLPKDYAPPVINMKDFYKPLADRLKPYIFPEGSTIATLNNIDNFENDFSNGGYYSVNVTDDLMVIILNTNYWNTKCYNLNPKTKTIGIKQLIWLNKQLEVANETNNKVIIAGHIPPGKSTYGNKGSFWLKNFTSSYIVYMTKYRSIIKAQLFGHVHQDKVKLHQLQNKFPIKTSLEDTAFLLICPSITPIFKCNPAFRLFTLHNSTKNLYDYAQYYMDLSLSNVQRQPLWSLEYTFTELYGRSLELESVIDLVDHLITTVNSTWLYYSNHMLALYGKISMATRFTEYCAARYINNGFDSCVEYYKSKGG